MAQEIVIAAGVPDRVTAGGLTRINRVEDLRSGTYWRAKDEVPALTQPSRRQRGVYLPEDHPDYREDRGHGQSEANRVGTEDYFVDVPVRGAIPEGRMHLVRSLKLVDGDIHAVVLQGHPSEGDKVSYTFLFDEFLARFELVDDEEAKRIRDAEVAALQDDITKLQHEMMKGPPAEAPVALLGHQARLPSRPTVGTMIANIDQVPALQAMAERAVAVAERQTKWITEHTAEIGRRTQALVPFFQERATAALASTDTVMRYANELRKGVETLGLYTGQDVTVKRLAEGESAPVGMPITILRSMLYMDEEYLRALDEEKGDGGADHKDFDDFVAQLAVDEALRRRVLPQERMVVLMRYRRTAKTYVKGDGIGVAFANAEYNKPNMAQFLLVRDGQNYWQVWSDLTTQSITALFPDKAMGDQPFRGIDGATIGPDDLNLSEAKGRFDDLNRVYKNCLVLMAGLDDRLGLFGPYAEERRGVAALLDPDFQERHLVFHDPDARGATIGTGRPPFGEWVRKMNGWLRSGSRVLVTEGTIRRRGAFNGSEPEERQPYALHTVEGDPRAHEFVVRKNAKGFVVSVEAGRQVYPRGKRSYYLQQTFDFPLPTGNGGYDHHGQLEWLCLDMVDPADIDHYLESRLDRRAYMDFYFLLLAARDRLRDEQAEMEPLVARLIEAFAEAGATLPGGESVRSLARQAIRLWRCSNRGAMPPEAGTAAHPAAYKAMLNSMWALAGNDHPIEAAEDLAQSEGREPLRLVMTGNDRFALYATSVGDEIESTLFEHVWVTRLACQRKGGRLAVTSRAVMPMPDAVADEEVLKDWDALADWKGRDVPTAINANRYGEANRDRYDYNGIRRALDKVRSGTLSRFVDRPTVLELRLDMLNCDRRRKTGKSGMVARLTHVQPFAIIRTTGFTRRRVEGFEARWEDVSHTSDFLVLALQDCPYRMAYRTCETEAERSLVAKAYASLYDRQESNRATFLEDVSRAPTVGASRLVGWARANDDADLREPTWRTVPLEANWSEAIRGFDVQNRPYGRELWVPAANDLVVWIDPHAPAILNAMCERFGWEPVPFEPKVR